MSHEATQASGISEAAAAAVNAGLAAGLAGAGQARSGAVERLPATGAGMRGESPGPAPGRYVREK
jgi:hypothetical protein